jgi:AraC-like DNA-binding protein
MRKEKHFWNKHFIVLRPVASLLVPENIVLAQAESTVYQNPGIGRSKRHKGRMVFQYTLSGRGVFERDGKRYDLTAGKAFFCDVLDEKMVYYYPDDATEPWRFLYLTIYDRTGWSTAINELFGYVFSIASAEPQIQQLLSYGEVPELSIKIDAGAAHVFANSLLGMLVDQAQADTRKHNTSMNVVRRALDAIEANKRKPFNAATLAKQIGVSQEHLNRTFRVELGRTPYQCICDTKMRRACELLKNTDQTIANVAAQLGFEPDSHFARLFKRVIGISPSQFRSGSSMPVLRPIGTGRLPQGK